MRANHPERSREAAESKGCGSARPIGEFIGEVRRDLRRPATLWPERLETIWAQAAGPQLSAAVRVLGYRAGTLSLATASAAVRGEIEAYRRDELLRRLNALMPAPVTALRVRLG